MKRGLSSLEQSLWLKLLLTPHLSPAMLPTKFVLKSSTKSLYLWPGSVRSTSQHFLFLYHDISLPGFATCVERLGRRQEGGVHVEDLYISLVNLMVFVTNSLYF